MNSSLPNKTVAIAKQLLAIIATLALLLSLTPLAWAHEQSANAAQDDTQASEVAATSITTQSASPTSGWKAVSGCEWKIDGGALYIRPLSGATAALLDLPKDVPWAGQNFIRVVISGTVIAGENLSRMFANAKSLESIEGLKNLDTSLTTDMSEMFSGCSKLASIDVSKFNTSQVKDFRMMFDGCSKLTALDLSSFETKNATSMLDMFADCSSLTSLNVSSFNTSNVTEMSCMFFKCSSLTSLNLQGFNTAKVTDYGSMFDYANALSTITVGSSFTLQSVFPDKTWYNQKGQAFTSGSIPTKTAATYTTKKPGSSEPTVGNTAAQKPGTAPTVTGTWKLTSGRWWFQLDAKSQQTLQAPKNYPVDAWVVINGKRYHFDGQGYMDVNWKSLDGAWYYFGSDGAMRTGWQYISGAWYRLASDGVMLRGWFDDGRTRYYLNESGAMHTGWKQVEGKWYYFTGSGAMAKGWVKLGGTWYFLERSTGVMLTGLIEDGGAEYYLAGSGAMLTGWHVIVSKWHYFHGSGAMAKGWLKLGGTWYYLDESTGQMQTGWLETDKQGTKYYLTESGAMVTGWNVIKNQYYYFASSGVMQRSTWIGGTYWVGADGVWVQSAKK